MTPTAFAAAPLLGPTSTTPCCHVIELRQYTLHPGQREVLIEVFERELLETQEATGMHVVAQFRQRDRPNRFVWVRAFESMPTRKASLEAFYFGPVWKAHRDVANPTMIDASNVLLLKPAYEGSAFALPARSAAADALRAGDDADATASRGAGIGAEPGVIVATILSLREPPTPAFVALMRNTIEPDYAPAGATHLASFVTEQAANTFERLPVREGEHVYVHFMRYASGDAPDAPRFAPAIDAAYRENFLREPEVLVLDPTSRSRVR